MKADEAPTLRVTLDFQSAFAAAPVRPFRLSVTSGRPADAQRRHSRGRSPRSSRHRREAHRAKIRTISAPTTAPPSRRISARSPRRSRRLKKQQADLEKTDPDGDGHAGDAQAARHVHPRARPVRPEGRRRSPRTSPRSCRACRRTRRTIAWPWPGGSSTRATR